MYGGSIKREVNNQLKGLGASWDAASPVTVLDDCHFGSFKRKQTKGSDFLMTLDLRGWKHGLWLAHNSLENLPLSVYITFQRFFAYLLINTLCTGDTNTDTHRILSKQKNDCLDVLGFHLDTITVFHPSGLHFTLGFFEFLPPVT